MSIIAVEDLIRRMANRFGVDIHRHRPETSELGQLVLMLNGHDVNLVFDVGANTGQFARALRKAGYIGRIVSFEPLSEVHAQLVRSSEADPHWHVAPRGAIGDCEGELDLHVAGNSVSSSALEMLDLHIDVAPGSRYVGKERVKVMQLDAVACNYVEPDSTAFLKIDTQGYEDRVLGGAAGLLKSVSGLKLELSLIPLYEDQWLFSDLVDRLSSLGFSIWSIWPGICDPRSHRMLQVDAVFFRD